MKKNVSRIAAGAAVIGAAVLTMTSVTAPADAGKLPGGVKTKNLGDGNSVTIRLYDESVRVARAVTNVPTSREAWVSGKARVTTKGDVKGGTITAGYLVGCQVTFGAGASATSPTVDQSLLSGLAGGSPDLSTLVPSTGGNITLGPGQAGFVPIVNTTVDDTTVNSFNFSDARGGVAYSQERFGVDGCAGYAQARALVKVRVSTDTFVGNVTLYGKPFSLG